MAQAASDKLLSSPQWQIPPATQEGYAPFEYAPNAIHARTKYWVWGDLSNGQTPLIVLHGGPGVTHKYLLPLSVLHAKHGIPVVLYDQVGCGESTRYREKMNDFDFWSVDMFMAELDNLKLHLGIKSFDLYGHSWGGMLAGQYAIERQPPGLGRLIISDAPSDARTFENAAGRLRKALPEEIQSVLDRCERDGTTESEEYEEAEKFYYARHVCRLDPLPQELQDSFAALKEDPTSYYTMWGPNEFFIVGSLKAWSITQDLHKISEQTCPGGVLLLNGKDDEVQDDAMQPFQDKVTAKCSWHQFARSSHMPFAEEHDEFIEVVGSFLRPN